MQLKTVENTTFSNGRTVGSWQCPVIGSAVCQLRGSCKDAFCSNKEIESLRWVAVLILLLLLGARVALMIIDGDAGLRAALESAGLPPAALPRLRRDMNHSKKTVTKMIVVENNLKKLRYDAVLVAIAVCVCFAAAACATVEGTVDIAVAGLFLLERGCRGHPCDKPETCCHGGNRLQDV